jgi:hypothetical protein
MFLLCYSIEVLIGSSFPVHPKGKLFPLTAKLHVRRLFILYSTTDVPYDAPIALLRHAGPKNSCIQVQ